MIHPLKITSTLADDTRFKIYEYMMQEKESFTVQQIAERFNIHPNVARLHLTKLTEINVVISELVKTGRGGRPGRIYKTSEYGVSISFPRREDATLLKWTLEIIHQLGESALQMGCDISYKDGYQQMQQLLSNEFNNHHIISTEQKIETLSKNAALIGYIPTIQDTPNGKSIIYSLYNCPFHSQLHTHNIVVCALHESFLKGQVDALFTKNEFIQIESMTQACKHCKYEINVTE